jgi:hypothetical protein
MSDNSSIIRQSAQSLLKICNSHWLGFERAQPILSRSQPVEKSVDVPDLETTGCRLLPSVQDLHSPPGQKKNKDFRLCTNLLKALVNDLPNKSNTLALM